MSREIKFRAWEVAAQQWANEAYLECCGPQLKHIRYADQPEQYVLEQWTGLKDEDGVLIYEGDIIENKFGRRSQIVWHTSAASFHAIRGDGSSGLMNLVDTAGMCEGKVKVIGNVHQNMDLLSP